MRMYFFVVKCRRSIALIGCISFLGRTNQYALGTRKYEIARGCENANRNNTFFTSGNNMDFHRLDSPLDEQQQHRKQQPPYVSGRDVMPAGVSKAVVFIDDIAILRV